MQGRANLDLSGHVVILGYAAGRTERIVGELINKGRQKIALCAWDDQVAEHPISNQVEVEFVRGDLAEDSVLERACLSAADVMLIDARDDNEAISVAVAANHVAPRVHTVVALRDMSRSVAIGRVDQTVRCVPWNSTQVIAEEIQDPGISLVYNELMTEGGGNTYSAQVPTDLDGRNFGEYQRLLGTEYAATILGFLDGEQLHVSPPWETPVPSGATLFYVATERLGVDRLRRLLAA